MVDTAAGRIVVGVDGSEQSREALRWAVRQARLTGGSVHAVMSWEWPGPYSWAGLMPVAPDDLAISEAADRVLSETVNETIGERPSVPVTTQVSPGSATQVLLEAAEGASLLVVGSRGHGGFAGVLLGSVSQHVTQHAPCTVVVVRG